MKQTFICRKLGQLCADEGTGKAWQSSDRGDPKVTGKVKITSLFDKITSLFDKITTLLVKITTLFDSF